MRTGRLGGLFLSILLLVSLATPLLIISSSVDTVGAQTAPGEWMAVSNSPFIRGYAVGVVGAGKNIYIANGSTQQNQRFMRYNTLTGEWCDLRTSHENIKNAVAMAWDNSSYIYMLNGASYGTDAFFFYRYDIGTNRWARLYDTPHTQGAGDAMCWVPESALDVSDGDYLYAIVGKRGSGSKFYRYSVKNFSWSSELNLLWGVTDDGCSLVWTGGSHLYALRGEWHEDFACYDFARYDLINDFWTSMTPIPAYPHDGGSGGVGDGGSLLWIGGDHSDYIYALSGNQASPENPSIYDKRFYRYTISANSWERLADLPAGIGHQNGPRLGFSSGTGMIYCWRGCKSDPVLWMYCPPGVAIRGVEVSISPGYQENLPSGTIEYEVTVTNTGAVPDTYDLSASDNEGWGPILDSGSLSVPATESRTTTLTVTVPENALFCTEDNITVTVTSQTDDTVENSASCIAYTILGIRSVDVSVSPGYQENVPGWTLDYEVAVTNTGNVPDTYDLSASDNEGWRLILDNGSLSIPVSESRTTTLTVTVPENALFCTEDNITVTVTSRADNTVENSASCIAYIIPGIRSVDVSISPDYQENVPGWTLDYEVTVTNTGTIPDTYDLSASDTENWALWFVKRRPITISGAHPKNCQIKIVIPYDSDMRADYGDLRFYEDVGASELQYWIESYTADEATVWVRRLENKDSMIYVYYRNPHVSSASDGDAVFEFFDDFSGTSLDTNKWDIYKSATGSSASVDSGVLTLSAGGTGNYVIVKGKTTFLENKVIEARATADHYDALCDVGFSSDTTPTPTNVISWEFERINHSRLVAYVNGSGGDTDLGGTHWEGWHNYQIDWISSSSAKYYRDGVYRGEKTSIPTSNLSAWAKFVITDTYGHGPFNIDWILVREYISSEPTVVVGAEEPALVFMLPPVSLWPGENTRVILTVAIPEDAVACTKDNVTVTAISRADNTVENSASCTAHVLPFRDVEVSISPENQENVPGGTLKYTVTVTNRGNVPGAPDNYNLTAGDNENWGLTLGVGSLTVPPLGENRTTTLTVAIPENAIGCTRDNITVTAISRADNTVENSASCLAHAIPIVRGVEVIVEPDGQPGVIGENVVFTVTVKNTGNVWDNYKLENNDDAGWALKLDNDYLEIPENENRETKLTVSVPDNENLVCTTDNVVVVATAVDNAEVTDNDNATVHAVPSWTGTAAFSLVNLYTVNVDMTLDIYRGSKLVVKFYDYGGAFENENVIENFSTLPWHVEENENGRHPGIGGKKNGVKKARLVLTTDDTSNVISTIASFTVCKVDLETRFTEIPRKRFLAPTPEEKEELEAEFTTIPRYRFLAPC